MRGLLRALPALVLLLASVPFWLWRGDPAPAGAAPAAQLSPTPAVLPPSLRGSTPTPVQAPPSQRQATATPVPQPTSPPVPNLGPAPQAATFPSRATRSATTPSGASSKGT